MKTVRITNYSFDKEAKTITFNDITSVDLERIVSITNVTRGRQMFFHKFPSNIGTVATNVLTLAFDTNNNGYANSDKLLIEYLVDQGTKTIVSSNVVDATGQTSDIVNIEEAKGGIFYFNVSDISGTDTPTITFKLQAKDHAGNYIDVPGAATAAITSTGQSMLRLYPGISETANDDVSAALPRKYRVAYTVSGTDPSITFSVGLDPIIQ